MVHSSSAGMEVRAVAAAPAQQWPALAAGPGTSTEESDPATPGGPRDFVALEGDTPYTAAGGEEGALAAAHEGFTRAQVRAPPSHRLHRYCHRHPVLRDETPCLVDDSVPCVCEGVCVV